MEDSIEESQLRKRVYDCIRAINEKDIQTLIDIASDDVIVVFPDTPPFLGKKAIIDHYKRTFQIFDRDNRVVSIRINMSKTGDLAQCWYILDHFFDNVQVGRALSLMFLRFEDGVWRVFSLSQHDVDLNWTWE